MDTTDSRLTFDEFGVCDHCSTFYKSIAPYWDPKQEKSTELNDLVKKIKSSGKKNEFDCLMGMSGGIDSSYLLHKMVTEYNL